MNNLSFESVSNRKDLLPDCVNLFFDTNSNLIELIKVTEIDPKYADNGEFEKQYSYPMGQGANSIFFEAKLKATDAEKTGKKYIHGVCLIPCDMRCDLNKTVRKHLDAKRVSFADQNMIADQLNMEVGSITGVGIPEEYKLLVDSKLIHKTDVIVGGGFRKSKMLLDGNTFNLIPNAEIIDNLAF